MQETKHDSQTPSAPKLFLGIDGGGSKCRVRLEDGSGLFLAEATSGPANIATSIAQAQESITDAAVRALMYADVPLEKLNTLYVCAGLAGAAVPSALSEMQQWQHPFARLDITTDMHIACAGAHQARKGAVIIIGTGFCAGAIDNHQLTEFGGHGLLLSDGASGAWLGLSLVRHTLEVLDGLSSSCPLNDALLQYTHCNTAIELTAQSINAAPGYFAQFAPLVFSHGHEPLGKALLSQAAHFVSRYIDHLQQQGYSRICLMGGVAHALEPSLSKEHRALLTPMQTPPESGALQLLRHRLGVEL
ncbi:BadF/BadG/BcrA/BcrD ATPase family protein [Pseudoalteromonas sp. BDTF-M6]|uniref:BadF/BadG/BcrA/BcrD ATPase family protein n=1 Tax=Pseudoalteromonas sp. BDTF-M6 TaxID=2796132 RepID=UPI001BB06E0C|nr:BadF/BadG/BcrA/BcrD ATPase family protein [Pseudoalteromonas sp. BDTF-M6]MBS3796269.1 N-acetylglucosamine kinase [Pseudoalteromonas sp. BDTF-M6]